MQGSRRRTLVTLSLVEFPDQPIDEPPLVGHRQCAGVLVRESSVVHQEERWFEDQLFLVTGLKAKETSRPTAW